MEIAPLIGQIYDCVDDEAQWDGVLESIYRLFDCSAASFQSVSPITGELALWTPHGFDQGWIDEYQKNWHDKNPLPGAVADFVLSIPVEMRHITAHTDCVLGPGVYQKTHVYKAFFRPSDLADHIALPLDMTGTPTGIGIWASHRNGAFDESQVDIATTLSRHLSRAKHLSNKIRYVKNYAANGEINTVFDPAFVIDQHFQFLDHNDPAEKFLTDESILGFIRGRIVFESDTLRDYIQRSFHKFAFENKPTPMTPNICVIEINNKWSLTIYALPIPTGQKYLMPLQSEYLLRFTENMFQFDKFVDNIAEKYALTQTEKEVAAMMAEGLSVSDITRKRSTKISTTRWHVKQLFHKFDVSNQRELIRKIFLQ